jgi:DNA-binding XRE family transcriptional regulator
MFSKSQSNYIKKILKQHSLTQQYLGHHFHYTRQYINNIVSGRYECLHLEDKIMDFIESLKS